MVSWTIQAEALRKALCEKDVPAKVYVGMRYWHPFTEEAIEQVGGLTYILITCVFLLGSFSN
jgi:protoporphyrin/coproporphyrin ferrochelatase